MKKYSDYVSPGAAIIQEVYLSGESGGWAGSVGELETLKVKLAAFNVHYVDDMRGIWKWRP